MILKINVNIEYGYFELLNWPLSMDQKREKGFLILIVILHPQNFEFAMLKS